MKMTIKQLRRVIRESILLSEGSDYDEKLQELIEELMAQGIPVEQAYHEASMMMRRR